MGLAGLALVALAGIALAAPGALTLLIGADESWARVQREGVLRVGMDASYPPFELVDDAGRFSGLDVD
ncbi:MAG: hypothetical protein V1772_09945, partial [Chloroflexota bacterium]